MEHTEPPPLLTVAEMKERYRDEWLLLVDCRISENSEIEAGRVAVHSRCRDDIHRAQMGYSGHVAIHFAGDIPRDLAVILWGKSDLRRG